MTRAQTIFLIVLTAIYLLIELAFNARLVDVAGGAERTGVDGLEIYGRILSGVAVALIVLQLLLKISASSKNRSPNTFSIVFWCLAAAAVTTFVLWALVELLVKQSSGEFRKASATILIVQGNIISGHADLGWMSDEAKVFASPEGKTLIALLPFMASQVWPVIDQQLQPIKEVLVQRAVSERLGGAQGLYMGPYQTAMKILSDSYLGRLPEPEVQRAVEGESTRSWEDYKNDLSRRGWTPITIPFFARKRVVEEMHRRIGVPRSWNPTDQLGFRLAIERRVRRALLDNPGTIYEQGRVVARGLTWPAYVAHPFNQQRLQNFLGLPRSVAVKHEYQSAKDFEDNLFRPLVKAMASKEMFCLNNDAISFTAGGLNSKRGEEAARAAIVPIVALFFSLLGALGHFAKLLYLLTYLALQYSPVRSHFRHWAAIAPLGLLLIFIYFFTVNENVVTKSKGYKAMSEKALLLATADGQEMRTRLLFGVIRIVTIGQAAGYPLNSYVRTSLLNSFEFQAWGDPKQMPAEDPSAEKRVLSCK